jgi:hypothetical protein
LPENGSNYLLKYLGANKKPNELLVGDKLCVEKRFRSQYRKVYLIISPPLPSPSLPSPPPPSPPLLTGLKPDCPSGFIAIE